MKKISLISLIAFLAQCLFQPLWAQSLSPQLSTENLDAIVLAEGEVPQAQGSPESKPSKDEEFSERSQKGIKFFFKDLPRHLGYDIKESFWGWGSLGLGIGIAMVAGLHGQDDEIQSSFRQGALFGKTGDAVIGYLGAPYTMGGVGILTLGFGALYKNEKLQTTGECVLEALFWTELFTLALQYGIDRTRPNGTGHGFPSAHTAGAFSTATVFQMMYGPKVGIPLYALATLVAISRVDEFQHFPSDVLMGAILGSFIAYGTTKFHKKLHNNFAVSPQIGGGRYGLVVHHAF